MNTLLKWALMLTLYIAGNFAFAQIPPTQYSEGIAYISGGVGEEEAQAILTEAKQWPLLLELSQLENNRGIWIFGARIKVSNSKKQMIFDAQADGPYMLINLDSGEYLIQASYKNIEQRRQVSIKDSALQKISIFWK